MSNVIRQIVYIDPKKCDGCGLCVPACAEGAIQIIDGKAQLVSDTFCDGLGACLGECPQGAITIVEREAQPFDEVAVMAHAAAAQPTGKLAQAASAPPSSACPGTAVRGLRLNVLPVAPQPATSAETPSGLKNWPVQLHLVPPAAAFLRDADLLLVADCVPVALADFHRRFPGGRPVVIACPKLDDTRAYVEKLAQMLVTANLRSLTVVHMEVPCCLGLVRLAQAAMRAAGREIPLEDIVVALP